MWLLPPYQVIRSGQKVVAKKAAGGQKQGGGFFSSLFGRKNKKEEQEEEESKETESKYLIWKGFIGLRTETKCLMCSDSGLDELMTTDEKEKLYSAIGYSGSSHSLTLPKQVECVVLYWLSLAPPSRET